MTTTTIAAATSSELLSLLKPRVMTLVVFSGAVGMLLAPGDLHPFFQLLAVASIALGSGAGGMINMWFDRDIDAIMRRTQNRPLPRGTVNPDDVLIVGIMLAVLSVAMMGLAANWLAAGILTFAIFFYAVIYTMWLKRSTPQNIVIGGAAGAFPPVIGWAAMAGSLTIEPIILFLIIFLWTPPHFWALALYRNDDYRLAGIPMMPVIRGMQHTMKQMVAYSVALLAVTLSPWAMGWLGTVYGAGTLLLSGYFLYLAVRLCVLGFDIARSKQLFGYSILYLFLLFSLMLMDRAFAGFNLSV